MCRRTVASLVDVIGRVPSRGECGRGRHARTRGPHARGGGWPWPPEIASPDDQKSASLTALSRRRTAPPAVGAPGAATATSRIALSDLWSSIPAPGKDLYRRRAAAVAHGQTMARRLRQLVLPRASRAASWSLNCG